MLNYQNIGRQERKDQIEYLVSAQSFFFFFDLQKKINNLIIKINSYIINEN